MTTIDNTGAFKGEHEAILQGLGKWLPYPGLATVPGGSVFYGPGSFIGTEKAWDQVPVLFIPPGEPVRHPDHDGIRKDPEGEAARLGYRIAGSINNARVETGDLTDINLIADIVLTDPQASALARTGRLGLSTGFDALITREGRIEGSVVPNHLLTFVHCDRVAAGHCGRPNDPRAAFNNAEPADETYDDRLARYRALVYDKPPEQMTTTERSLAEEKARRMATREPEWKRNRDAIVQRGKYDPLTHEFRPYTQQEIFLEGLDTFDDGK